MLKKRFFLFFISLFSFVFLQAQLKWQIRDSVIKFPNNFGSWIQRNIGTYNPFNEKIGTKVASFQLKSIGDFNKDGFNDLCFEMDLNVFRWNGVTNIDKFRDSSSDYYRGIFINQKNGTFLLDTNYIIHGRGRPWEGHFGDFNGDGLIDYYSACIGYESNPLYRDTLYYRYPRYDNSPSHVFFNNGKTFDKVDLDTVNMLNYNSDVIDINNDGKDEIIAVNSAKFFLYEYDIKTKVFNSRLSNINDIIYKKYGNNIKFINFKERPNNSILLTLSYNTPGSDKLMIDILKVNLIDSTVTSINSFYHPFYTFTDGTIQYAEIADKKGILKYEDINNDQKDELIFIGAITFKTALPTFQSNQRMGINIIENNQLNTSKFWNIDTTEIGFRVGGYIIDLDNDKKSEIISEEWIKDTSNKYFAYYYTNENGKFTKKFIQNINKSPTPVTVQYKYQAWPDDFTKDGTPDILIYNPDNLMTNYLYKSFYCKDVIAKPIFNTNKYTFCANDSLKLSITNVNIGDTLKWYYGTKTDLTNVSSKIFSDSVKLFVTRTDTLGCIISSDTVQLLKNPIPTTPSISRDTSNNLISNASIGNVWYKDGTALTDTTQKIKPGAAGSYTVKTTQNGCASALSSPYYFLVTDIINLSKDEYIKLAPNPFINQLNFDFVVKGYQRLNLEIFDLATGVKVASKQNLTAGISITLGHLSAGNYIIKVSSNDNKIVQQFKMVKL